MFTLNDGNRDNGATHQQLNSADLFVCLYKDNLLQLISRKFP